MTRPELTEILLTFLKDDSQQQVGDPRAFLEALRDENFESFARGYLKGIHLRLRHYEELLYRKEK